MPRRIAFLLLATTAPMCVAQQATTPALTQTSPTTVSTPVTVVGVATDALVLLAQYQAAVGGVDLTALQGTGTITLPGSTVPLPANLVISGSNFSRVNISNSTRLAGFAAKGALHKSYYVDGTSAVDSVWTGPASISAFQLLSTKDVMSKLLSLSKDTATDSSGAKYDRLRARHAFSSVAIVGQSPSTAKTANVDYYFDPTTHVLIKSVTALQIPGILNPIPLETNYSDYRLVGVSKVPFRISQTLNGQPDWVLALTSVTLPLTLDSSLTTF